MTEVCIKIILFSTEWPTTKLIQQKTTKQMASLLPRAKEIMLNFQIKNALHRLLTTILPLKLAKTVKTTKNMSPTWKSVSPLSGCQTPKPSMSFSKTLINSSKLISMSKRPTPKELSANVPLTNLSQSTTPAWHVLLKKYSTSPPNLAKMDVLMDRYSVNKTPNALMPLSSQIPRLLICCRLWGTLKSSEQPRSNESNHRQLLLNVHSPSLLCWMGFAQTVQTDRPSLTYKP